MSTTTSSARELTSTQVQKFLTLPLQAASTFLAAGPKVIQTAGPIRLPKLGGPISDPGFTAESTLIPTRDVDFEEVSLMPTTMQSVKVIVRFSRELARQSVVALDSTLQQRLVTDVAKRLDAQFWSAEGDGITTPKGILAYGGAQEVAGAGSALTFDRMLDAWGKALSANVNTSGLKWVMRSDQFVALRKQKDTDGRYLLQPDPTVGGVFTVFGVPVIVTNSLPTTGAASTLRQSVVLADFSQIAVAQDVNSDVTVLTERYADFDELALRVVSRFDVAPLNPEAVIRITNLTA